MGRKWWGKGETAGCDEAAAAAAGDSGGGAPSPSSSSAPSSSSEPSYSSAPSSSATPSTATPSTPRSPRSTASSTSPPQSPRSSASSSHEEIPWGEEQEFDQFNNYFGSIHLGDKGEEQECDQLNNSNLGDKESVLTLDNYNDEIISGQIMLLSKKYGFLRRIAGDGSCFYRAFIFSYLENVVETNDEAKRKAEAARLRQRVEKCMLACYRSELLHTFSGFESVVNLIEQGLPSGELYHMEKNEHVTSQILPLLRSLTEIELCSKEHFYHDFLGGSYGSVFELCLCEVRPECGQANHIQVTALANALGIPIILENLDKNTPGRLNTEHIYPSRESGVEALEQEQSVDSDDSTTPMAQVEHDGSRKLSPAEWRRLVTLLYRPGHYDIIYPK